MSGPKFDLQMALPLSAAIRRHVPADVWSRYEASTKRPANRPKPYLHGGSLEASRVYRERMKQLEIKKARAADAVRRSFLELVTKGKLVVFVRSKNRIPRTTALPADDWPGVKFRLGSDELTLGADVYVAWVMEASSAAKGPNSTAIVEEAASAASTDTAQTQTVLTGVHLAFDDQCERVMLPNGRFIEGTSYRVLSILAAHAAADQVAQLAPSQRRSMNAEELANKLRRVGRPRMIDESATSAVSACRKRIRSLLSLDPRTVIETLNRGYRLHPSVSFAQGGQFVGASNAMLEPARR